MSELYDFRFEDEPGGKTMRLIPLNDQAHKHLDASAPGSKWSPSGGLIIDADGYLPLLFAFTREGWRVQP